MKKLVLIGLVLILAFASSGCLITGQVTFIETIDIGLTTNAVIKSFFLDFNSNDDYLDNKDDIKSVDALAVVAVLKNNAAQPAVVQIWITRDLTTFTAAADIRANGILFFESPTVPANSTLKINWADAFLFTMNEQAVIDEVLGDGDLTVYGIAKNPLFDLEIDAEVQVTVTVGK